MSTQVKITSGEYELTGYVYSTSVSPAPGILYIHGWTSSQKKNPQYVEALADQGYTCLTIDLPGHGESQGDIEKLTRVDYERAVIAAYDYLAGHKNVNPNNISVIGSSFGSYLALLLSAKRKLSRIALRVPANYPDEGFDQPHTKFAGQIETKQWREGPRGPSDTYALAAIHKFRGQVLIVESENDDLVPQQAIINYINAVVDKTKLTHLVMKSAPHSLQSPEHIAKFQAILTDWFADKV